MTDITADTPAQRLGRRYAYLLGGLPLGIAAFVVAIAGFAAGAGTLVVWMGLPILAGTLRAARGFAALERRATQRATGRDLPPHHYRPTRGSGIRRWSSALADPQSWRDLLHAVVAFPIQVAGFAIAVGWVPAASAPPSTCCGNGRCRGAGTSTMACTG